MDLHKGDPNTQNPRSEYVFNNLNFVVLFILDLHSRDPWIITKGSIFWDLHPRDAWI